MLPKAEGGAGVIHADAKLAVREAINGLPDGHIKIVAIATETATALFLAGTYRGASARLDGLTWGAEDLSAELGAETNRDAEGRFLDPYRLARALCLAGAAAAQVQAIDTVYVDFRNIAALRRETRGSAPRRLYRQDGDPSGAGADHQRGVHADAGGRRQGAGRRRGLRCQSRQGHRRHRRGDVRSPASRARPAIAGAGEPRRDPADARCAAQACRTTSSP